MSDVNVSVSARATAALRAAADGATTVRLRISERFEHDVLFDDQREGDVAHSIDGLTLVLDPASAARAGGVSIDYVDGPQGPGFRIVNPNQPPRIVQLSALELKAMRDRGETFELVDVRTEGERALAAIDGSRLLDHDYHRYLLGLDRTTPLVFQCHHGIRSQAAAEYFLEAGFTSLFNLRGGIDAWSQLVDRDVARY